MKKFQISTPLKAILQPLPNKFLKSIAKRFAEANIAVQSVLNNKIGANDFSKHPDYTAPIVNSDIDRQTFLVTESFLQHSDFPEQDVIISFLIPSRAKNNPTFNLGKLLDSAIENAENINRCEFIVVIDADDDLQKYVEIKKLYNNKARIRIFISLQRHGYFNLHRYWKIAFDNMSPYSKMFNPCTDDITIYKKHFDRALLAVDRKFHDNVYIVHTIEFAKERLFGRNHKSDIKIHNDYKTMFYLFATEGTSTSFFPFVSRAFYEEGKKLQTSGKIGKEWAYIFNCYAGDWYSSMLGDFIGELGLENRVIHSNMILRDPKAISEHHKSADQYGFPEYKYLFQTFFKESTIDGLKKIARATYNRTAKAKIDFVKNSLVKIIKQ